MENAPVTNRRLLIVGGGPAGLEAARAYRKLDSEGQIVMISADDHPPYNRPPLSKDFLRGESEEQGLPLEDEDYFLANRIELRLGTTASALDTTNRMVTLAGGEMLAYDLCILATGATAKTLPVPGAEDPGLHRLRFVRDARRLREAAGAAASAIVIGSGFIGCEAAVSLARRGMSVTLVSDEERPQEKRLGTAMGDRLKLWLEEEGVTLRLGQQVEVIEAARRVWLDDGASVDADLVLVAAGAEGAVTLAHEAGLEVEQDRVRVDAHMRTSDPHVLAAGDVAFALNAAAGRHLLVEHWGEALEMGRVAGETAAGRDTSWSSVPGFWSEIGDHTIKYAAWGDSFDNAHLIEHGQRGFTVWYQRDGVAVGVLTHEADDDYELGQQLIEAGLPVPPDQERSP
jgi:3-phenylpropionate/trans-cinnamate dioxygenase ferredoxin reductase subunit